VITDTVLIYIYARTAGVISSANTSLEQDWACILNAWDCLYDVGLCGTSMRDEKTVKSLVRTDGSWFIVLLAEVPGETVSHLRRRCLYFG
jgi:hypothetical protein